MSFMSFCVYVSVSEKLKNFNIINAGLIEALVKTEIK